MFRNALLALPILAGLVAAGSAHADDASIVLTQEQVRWVAAPADFPKHVEIAYVYGNASAPGPFVIRVRMPAHAQIAPHTHNMDETLTVLSGRFTHFIGRSFTGAREDALAAGGFVHLPKGTPHALRTADSPVVVEVSGVGPFGMTYVNPADDPSRAK
ncbi:cupin domain-containing protein [Gluconacetobacter tumulicola]|uniref:Cupin domain-containing protein n=1 Tax=Gluconacetobacter tumulicola TaxID=1017177 RepID=A0A7W4JEA5_9PROT|nr:cupin domain-containing protein [Gluconacetobacter tumulicola]MBB2179678.1 cupin domain-containing protein [Gluconacetobacter tumulicola]